MDADEQRIEQVQESAARLLIRLYYLALMALGTYATYRAAGTPSPPAWLTFLVVLTSIWVACNRPILGGCVVLLAGFTEWILWEHGPGLGPLPATVATSLAPAVVVGAVNIYKPPRTEPSRPTEDEQNFPRVLFFIAPLTVVWMFGWAKTLQ